MSGNLRTRPSAALRTFTLAVAGASMLFGVEGASPSQPATSSPPAAEAPVAAQDAPPAPAPAPIPDESTSGRGSSSSARGSSSTSSTISFKKEGKTVSIEENGSGITVTVDGTSVQARDAEDLKERYPDAYRLYVEKPGFAVGSAGGSASASGSQSSSSTKGSRPGSSETRSSKSRDRSVTVTDHGTRVTISENASGITVTAGEKVVRARDADELKKDDAEAFRLYERHLDNSGAWRSRADAAELLRGSFEEGPGASDLLREKLEEMRLESADDPRLQGLIEAVLKELAQAPAPADLPAAGGVAPTTAESTSDGGSNSVTRGSSSTSSTISFKKDGKVVSIRENGSGITVTVDGKSLRARDVDDLKKRHPDAYRLYAERPGFAVGSAGGSASASSSQSSSSTKGSRPGGSEAQGSKSRDRSVTVTDHGTRVTIAENASGITVTIGEQVVRARNADELRKESVEAFRLYERHLNGPGARRRAADAEDLLPDNVEEGPSASDLLREKLEELRSEDSDDPRVRELIERLLKEMDK